MNKLALELLLGNVSAVDDITLTTYLDEGITQGLMANITLNGEELKAKLAYSNSNNDLVVKTSDCEACNDHKLTLDAGVTVATEPQEETFNGQTLYQAEADMTVGGQTFPLTFSAIKSLTGEDNVGYAANLAIGAVVNQLMVQNLATAKKIGQLYESPDGSMDLGFVDAAKIKGGSADTIVTISGGRPIPGDTVNGVRIGNGDITDQGMTAEYNLSLDQ